MKTRKAFLLAAGVLAATPNIFADKVQFNSLPQSVQDAIRSRSGTAVVEDIDRDQRNGKTTYQAAFKLRGVNQELTVAEDGTIVKDIPGASTALSGAPVTLNNKSKIGLIEAPLAVQRALQNQFVGSAQLQALHKGEWNKQTIYEASYDKNGQRQTFQVTETGQPVVATAQAAAPAGPRYAGLSDSNVSLAGGSKLNFTDAPKPVQNTVNQLSNGARVEDFEKGQWNGRTIYQAAFKKDGKHMELQVLEDGSLVTKQPGRPYLPATAAAPAGPRYAGLADANVTLSGGSKVDFQTAPEAVRNTVNQLSAGARVEDTERGVWNGRTVYEVAFKKNGQHTELQVLEDGSVLTKAPTAAGAPATSQTGP